MLPSLTVGHASVDAIQEALRADALDGWLLYDFRGLNPIATAITGVSQRTGHMATRRWFYLIPAHGAPSALVHAIEPDTLSHLPGSTVRYTGRDTLEAGLQQMLTGCRHVAMEYSPACNIPYVARVDAGTVELVRRCGPEVRSSADLVQRFTAVWTADQTMTHQTASKALHAIKDRAFAVIAQRVRDGVPLTEFDVQQQMVTWFAEAGLVSDSAPVVAADGNAGNPHYLPSSGHHAPIAAGSLVLLDLWGKLQTPGAVYADITWVGVVASSAPEPQARAFAAITQARDAAVALVETRTAQGRETHGWEVDRTAQTVLREAGYGDAILHRTGHSLGESVHGLGANMDDYETHDDRRLLPGTAFTIEPGLYFADFGVRTEINMIVGTDRASVTGPRQNALLTLL